MAKKKQGNKQVYRTVAYEYYCNKCSAMFKKILDFDDRLHQDCEVCGEKLKYKGGCDISVASHNVDFLSVDTVTKQNMKRIGNEQYQKMQDADPIVKGRRKAREEGKKCWWRKDGKPLDLSKIKNTEKYIQTGETD